MPRLFTAITIPKDVQSFLQSVQPDTSPGIVGAAGDQMHATLHFIGQVEDDGVDELQERLASTDARSFTLSIRGVGCFPSDDRPGFIWAGVETTDGLLALRDAVGDALQSCGFNLEARPYRPHVTLARVEDTERPVVARFLSDWRDLTAHFAVTEFALYSVGRVDGEPHYSPIRTFRLSHAPVTGD